MLIVNTKNLDKLSAEKKFQDADAGAALRAVEWVHKRRYVKETGLILSQWHKGVHVKQYYSFAGFPGWTEQALNIVKTGKCIFEDYSTGCKPYIDYEYTNDLAEYENNRKYFNDIAVRRMNKMIEYIRFAMKIVMNDDEYVSDIKVAKSHGISMKEGETPFYKFSYHFIVNSDYDRFKSSVDAKKLMTIILDQLEFDRDVTMHIDRNVYKSHQKMRCIFSTKTTSDTRVLESIDFKGGC